MSHATVAKPVLAGARRPPAALAQPPATQPLPTIRPAATAGAQASKDAAPGAGLVHRIPVEDSSGNALAAFHGRLRRLEQGTGDKVRVAVFGASHVASDRFTDVLRTRLQARFGDAGPGFLLTGKPRRYHHHGRAAYEVNRGFRGVHVRVSKPGIGRYGLAGVALVAPERGRARSRLRTRSPEDWPGRTSTIDLYYLLQPEGGGFELKVDDQIRTTLQTAAARPMPAFWSIRVPEGEHVLDLHTLGNGPVRLFGTALEGDGPGVIVDTLGVPGSRARYQLQWKRDLFEAHLTRRAPALVILAYGTNESGDQDVPLSQYERQLRAVVSRIQETLPRTSCVLIGPSDQPVRDPDAGAVRDRPRTSEVVGVQRRVSADLGCGFFDLVALMGGPLSMVRWVEAQPRLGARDHVHFTPLGYERVGEVLYEALMSGYAAGGQKRTTSATAQTP